MISQEAVSAIVSSKVPVEAYERPQHMNKHSIVSNFCIVK